ncbi:cyclin-like protein [Dichotomocladium elegans]|nr:cyclin-like protein [Dichotomocladium elegans]
MGTTKSRKSRRNNSRPAAFTFLSNISLGTETADPQHTQQQQQQQQFTNTALASPVSINSQHATTGTGSLLSTDSNASADQHDVPGSTAALSIPSTSAVPPVATAPSRSVQRRRWSVDEDESVQHHKLTREDSERPIASEKIKKKSHNIDKEVWNYDGLLSVMRYYTEKIRFSSAKRKGGDQPINRGYLQQQLANHDSSKRRPALSYAHFLVSSHSLEDTSIYVGDYDPYFLDNDSYNRFGNMRPSDLKRELNEQFRMNHPEIQPEITLSKIRAIKAHLVEIGKVVDLEVSSVAHAFVYFEKLVLKDVVTKKNRKLIAACCLFLATKMNEAKGTWFEPLYQAIDDELDVDPKEIREHEFAVFADLEFNLCIPSLEYMPHFERIFHVLDYKSMEDYLGSSSFYKVDRDNE